MSNLTPGEFLAKATEKFGAAATVRKRDVEDFARDVLHIPHNEHRTYTWLFNERHKVRRSIYRLPDSAPAGTVHVTEPQPKHNGAPRIMVRADNGAFNPNASSEYEYAAIPERDQRYIPHGDYMDVERIIESKLFFPFACVGTSGTGKTLMIDQGCSRKRNAMIRVQVSKETDEDDLIGGFRLIDGETKFMKGPVLRAMELGVLLLIDEADRGDPGKMMCLQGILEGKPYYVKKTGEIIHPARGFNVAITMNTKGKGSDDGRYVTANVQDDALLERVRVVFVVDWAPPAVEKKMLEKLVPSAADPDEAAKLVTHLINWATGIRKTFNENACDEVISTRRLTFIMESYGVFGSYAKGINLCLARFDDETRLSWLTIYSKLDAGVALKDGQLLMVPKTIAPTPGTGKKGSDCPF